MRLRLRFRPRNAFSLVEVTLALGVISFALIGILAIFPTAMKTAADSALETKSLFLAQQLMAPFHAPHGNSTDALLPLPGGQAQSVPLSQQTEMIFAGDEQGIVVAQPAAGTWESGFNGPNAAFLARVVVRPLPDEAIFGNRTQVTVTVSSPAAAPLPRRSIFQYSSMVSRP